MNHPAPTACPQLSTRSQTGRVFNFRTLFHVFQVSWIWERSQGETPCLSRPFRLGAPRLTDLDGPAWQKAGMSVLLTGGATTPECPLSRLPPALAPMALLQQSGCTGNSASWPAQAMVLTAEKDPGTQPGGRKQ